MAHNSRHHLPPADYDDGKTPRHLTKQEFARRLTQLLLDKGWNQADLARAAEIGRDAVSTYVRGRSLPTPLNLRKIADALGVEGESLLPNAVENAVDNDLPSFEMREAAGHPGRCWVRVNRLLTFRQALAIAHVLDAEPAEAGDVMARSAWEAARRVANGAGSAEDQPDLPLGEET